MACTIIQSTGMGIRKLSTLGSLVGEIVMAMLRVAEPSFETYYWHGI